MVSLKLFIVYWNSFNGNSAYCIGWTLAKEICSVKATLESPYLVSFLLGPGKGDSCVTTQILGRNTEYFIKKIYLLFHAMGQVYMGLQLDYPGEQD